MLRDECFENFPGWIPAISISHALAVYALGALILSGIAIWTALLFLAYCLYVESTILRKSCAHCFYYGRVCALGRGKLCALLFPKGDPRQFLDREITWKQMVPDMLVLLIPLVAGIGLLVLNFSWVRLGMLLVLVFLSLGGNAIIRGSLACKFCRQRTIGCPAERFFNTPKTSQ
jgi:hypothetical protein